MDKVIAKQLFRSRDLPVADEVVVYKRDGADVGAQRVVNTLGQDVVIKPSSQGSGLGVVFGKDAVELASDKEETNNILRDLGLPVPKQRLVQNSSDAKRAAEQIGFPVVLKPLAGNHGRGVSVNLKTTDEVEVAFDKSREHGHNVIVESYLEGHDHRLLVVNGTFVAAAKRVPGHVVGDGRQSIEQLVEIVNKDPRRGVGHEKVLTRLELDEQAKRLLEKLGYDCDTVPKEGEIVYLRSTANLSTGGTAIDVTDTIHPDNREMAIRTINAIGLDIGGVDFLTKDISAPTS
jgi:cyanophycin synthetase